MNDNNITKEISVEDLVEKYPFAVEYLSEKGIRCIACGAPVWGTLGESCEEKGFDNSAIEGIIIELNNLNENFEKNIQEEMNNNFDTEDL